MTIKVLYFASVRERVGKPEEEIEPPAGIATVGQLMTWGVRFWLVAVIIAGSWAAIATFISSCFRSPILSLLTTFLAFFVMWMGSLIGFFVRAKDMTSKGMRAIYVSRSRQYRPRSHSSAIRWAESWHNTSPLRSRAISLE